MNKSKGKLTISIFAMIFVLLSALSIISIAFALTQQTITTTLKITYKAEDLDGSVYATYSIGGVERFLTPKATGGKVDGNSLVFSAGDKQDAGSLEFPESINLTSANDNIVVKYTYTNTGSKPYIASMSFDSKLDFKNMKVEYGILENGKIVYSSNRYALGLPGLDEENEPSTRSYWIKISIEDKSKTASFTGDFRWVLTGCDDDEASEYRSLSNLTFIGEDGSYSVSVLSVGENDYIGEIVFPSNVNNTPVTKIVQNTNVTDAQKHNITSVVIPASVTEIGEYAFKDYTSLQNISFEQIATTSNASVQSSSGLKVIGEEAFYNCVSLKSLILPDGLTSFGYNAYYGCISLKSITMPLCANVNFVNCMESCPNLESVLVEDIENVYAIQIEWLNENGNPSIDIMMTRDYYDIDDPKVVCAVLKANTDCQILSIW